MVYLLSVILYGYTIPYGYAFGVRVLKIDGPFGPKGSKV
jgi:hypothetical protein